jgi:tetratricopeptide (TPR) repeat protein
VSYGLLQERTGQLADALESFEWALHLDDTLYFARYRVGRLYYGMGQPLQALSHFKIVTQQRPGYLPAWRYIVQITWALGNVAEAERQAKEALSHAFDAEIAAMLERIEQDRFSAA